VLIITKVNTRKRQIINSLISIWWFNWNEKSKLQEELLKIKRDALSSDLWSARADDWAKNYIYSLVALFASIDELKISRLKSSWGKCLINPWWLRYELRWIYQNVMEIIKKINVCIYQVCGWQHQWAKQVWNLSQKYYFQ